MPAIDFHLSFSVPSFPRRISYEEPMLFMGSCFAAGIGERMQQQKFNVLINPHGILYNPLSIAHALKRYVQEDLLKENALFQANDAWHSWEHHGSFSAKDKAACLGNINHAIRAAHAQLKKANWLFITFGSAFVYERAAQLVGNCHKQPQKEFSKRLLSTREIVSEYTSLITSLKQFNPALNIVLTVSPVRYIRDGVIENSLSKSVLIQAVHELLRSEDVIYFPAYELVVDDLRDYRFYAADLVHPNEQAMEYVFEKLREASFAGETNALFQRLKDIRSALLHRPFHPDTDAHQKFRASCAARCRELQQELPFLDLDEEIRFFS